MQDLIVDHLPISDKARVIQCWEEPAEQGMVRLYLTVMLRDSERALLVDAIATEVLKRLKAAP